jgi:sulfur carrier protein ThiS
MIKILFLSNDAGGFAQYEEYPEGTTVAQVLASKDYNPANYMIRVNREEVSADQVLAEGHRLSITPTKVAGAR